MGLSRVLAGLVARMDGRKAECGEPGRYATIAQSNVTRPDPTRNPRRSLRATND